MANKIKAEFQDADGNIYHLHTSADVVFLEDGSTLESKLGTLVDSSGGDISETKISTVDTVSAGFPVPAAGESTKTFAGKVKKFFQDFVALKDTLLTLSKLVNNGQTTATGFALDARYGKTLYDLYAQLNSNLASKANLSDLSGVSNAVKNIHNLANVGYVTNFNGGGLANTPGRWNVYNLSGTAANAPYSGAVAGYVEVLINGDTSVAGNVVYQTLHDHWGDVYTKIIVAGTGYGTWKKLTP